MASRTSSRARATACRRGGGDGKGRRTHAAHTFTHFFPETLLQTPSPPRTWAPAPVVASAARPSKSSPMGATAAEGAAAARWRARTVADTVPPGDTAPTSAGHQAQPAGIQTRSPTAWGWAGGVGSRGGGVWACARAGRRPRAPAPAPPRRPPPTAAAPRLTPRPALLTAPPSRGRPGRPRRRAPARPHRRRRRSPGERRRPGRWGGAGASRPRGPGRPRREEGGRERERGERPLSRFLRPPRPPPSPLGPTCFDPLLEHPCSASAAVTEAAGRMRASNPATRRARRDPGSAHAPSRSTYASKHMDETDGGGAAGLGGGGGGGGAAAGAGGGAAAAAAPASPWSRGLNAAHVAVHRAASPAMVWGRRRPRVVCARAARAARAARLVPPAPPRHPRRARRRRPGGRRGHRRAAARAGAPMPPPRAAPLASVADLLSWEPGSMPHDALMRSSVPLRGEVWGVGAGGGRGEGLSPRGPTRPAAPAPDRPARAPLPRLPGRVRRRRPAGRRRPRRRVLLPPLGVGRRVLLFFARHRHPPPAVLDRRSPRGWRAGVRHAGV